ncbi:hypothetical protein [Flavobacterium flevense]|uniref:hypothetical protein n=1 Tax=Flavobacterium flevense TaxID=983 RepID=UPI0013566347|nr:hypothetical protein [Flavobacterium flevense]
MAKAYIKKHSHHLAKARRNSHTPANSLRVVSNKRSAPQSLQPRLCEAKKQKNI